MTVQKLFIIIGILSIAFAGFRHFRKKGDGLLLNFSQYFMGMLFVFSGFVKAIDPLGTSYKMHDYFEAFSQDGMASLWQMMSAWSLPISIFMIVVEIGFGIMILTGWKARIASIGLLAMNLFFLFLTGYSYLSGYCLTKQAVFVPAFLLLLLFLSALIQTHQKRFQALLGMSLFLIIYFIFCKFSGACATCAFTQSKMKVTDCGCFGDFMKLKPWETFYKDIFLTFISLILVRNYHKITELLSSTVNRIIVGLGFLLATIFCLYNVYGNEPIVDFRPYAVGNDINQKMEEIEPSITQNILIYKNTQTGEEKRFDINHLPTDTIWTFKDRVDSVIKEGIPAPIHNLRFEDAEGNDVTTSLLHEESISFWIVCYNTHKSNLDAFEQKIIPFAQEMRKQGINVYCLVGNSTKDFDAKAGAVMDLVRADETALKTMIRSNPGIMKIQNGKVLDKWHYRQFSREKVGI